MLCLSFVIQYVWSYLLFTRLTIQIPTENYTFPHRLFSSDYTIIYKNIPQKSPQDSVISVILWMMSSPSEMEIGNVKGFYCMASFKQL